MRFNLTVFSCTLVRNVSFFYKLAKTGHFTANTRVINLPAITSRYTQQNMLREKAKQNRIMALFVLVILGICISSSLTTSIQFDFPFRFKLESMEFRPFPWEATLFEHGHYGDRQVDVGDGFQTCATLNDTQLCK